MVFQYINLIQRTGIVPTIMPDASYLLPIKKQCKIEIKGYVSDKMLISDRDLCIMISNLIANAVEAVGKIKNEKKYILFYIKELPV